MVVTSALLLIAIATQGGLAKDVLRGSVQPTKRKTVDAVRASVANLPGQISRFRLTLSRSAPVSVFTLGEPYRLILDLPQTNFRRIRKKPLKRGGMIKSYRFGLISPGRSRVVIDLNGPFKLVDVRAVQMRSGTNDIMLDIGAVHRSAFHPQGVPPSIPRSGLLRSGVYDSNRPGAKAKKKRRRDRKRYVIVIDPGHGGPDSGAVGHRGILEKNVVLAVAKRLKEVLRSSRKYRVVMTRKNDVFVALDDRVEIARRLGANLFLSLHADAIPQRGLTASVRGATIYTLSQQASDRQARAFAQKENSSDALAGVQIANAASRGRVEAILFDLMRRETADFSERLREHLVRRLSRTISMSREPRRSAAFRVLQQPETPSVLLELGYMSNASDVKEMTRRAWQKSAAKAIAIAIDSYFSSRVRY
ncbi:MAG: N-acetylmuramoyl-L-alanine amidase [Hyphomicrobiaceae bacterium]